MHLVGFTVEIYCNLFNSTNTLFRKSRCLDQFKQEALDIKLHLNHVNWEFGFSLCKSLFYFTKRRKQKAFSKDRVVIPVRHYLTSAVTEYYILERDCLHVISHACTLHALIFHCVGP